MGQNKEKIIEGAIVGGNLIEPITPIDLKAAREDPSLFGAVVRPVIKEVLATVPNMSEIERFEALHGLNELAENARHSDNGSKMEVMPSDGPDSTVRFDINNTIDPEAFPEGEIDLACGQELTDDFHYSSAEEAPEHGYGCRAAKRIFKEKYRAFVKSGILHNIVELP